MSSLYTKLPSKTCIRMVYIEPPSRADPENVHLRLETVDLSTKPEYWALSYTWGLPMPQGSKKSSNTAKSVLVRRRVFCQGEELAIRPNLRNALFHLRTGKPHRIPFWIDALCINQDDVKERSSQVALMGSIYSQAGKVVVWLGAEDDDSRNAFKIIKRLGHTLANLLMQDRFDEVGGFYRNDTAFYRKYGIPEIGDDEWLSYIKFYDRTWFQRAWIIQEASLAKGLTFRCGESEVSYQHMVLVAIMTSQKSNWSAYLGGLLRPEDKGAGVVPGVRLLKIRELAYGPIFGEKREAMEIHLRRFTGAKNEVELCYSFFLQTLIVIRNCTSIDPRDKVYATIGLVRAFEQDSHKGSSAEALEPRIPIKLPEVDYDLSITKVYLATTELLIENLPWLTILSCVNVGTEPQIPDLPSWVPDFSEAQYENLWTLCTRCEDASYNACGNEVVSRGLPMVHGHSLHLSAALCDTIEEMASFQGDLSDTAAFEEWPNVMNISTRCGTPYANGESGYEVLWRTMTADQDEDGKVPASAEVGAGFTRILCLLCANVEAFEQVKKCSGAPSMAKIAMQKFLTCHSGSAAPTIEETHRLSKLSMFSKSTDADILSARFVEDAGAFTKPASSALDDRRLFRTSGNLLGLCPYSAHIRDSVYIIQGAKTPFVLRRCPNSSNHQLVGEAYLHGFMQGEFVNWRVQEARESLALF